MEVYGSSNVSYREIPVSRMIQQYSLFVDHVLRDIGGMLKCEGDTTRFYKPVGRDYMSKVMTFLGRYVLTPCDWLYQDSLGKSLGEDTRVLMNNFYQTTMETFSGEVCDDSTHGRIYAGRSVYFG